MYLRTLEYLFKNIWAWSSKISCSSRNSRAVTLKTIEVKLDILTDVDMLLKTKKYIKWGIRHYISQYAKPNNKYMTDNDKNKESPYIQYW